jgi:cytochrome c oxidase subunit IV
VVEYEGDKTTELERRLTPLKVVSLVEAAMWLLAAVFWMLGSRPAQLVLWSMHGMVVVAFAGMVLLIYRPLGWSTRFAVFAVLTGPIGAVVVFFRLRRESPAIHAREQAALRARAARASAGAAAVDAP